MNRQMFLTCMMAAALFALLGACATNEVNRLPVQGPAPVSCEPRLLGGYAVPTEKIAKAIYLSVYQGLEDRESPVEVDIGKSLRENGWRIVVKSDGGAWSVFTERDSLPGFAGGGFAATIDKCSGRILNAGYIR